MNSVLKNIVRFVLLLALQVIILNRILVFTFVSPVFYLLILLLLPFNISRGFLLVLGFLLGISVDIFTHTMGLHAAACLMIAYLRPFVMNILSPQGGFEPSSKTPSAATMGWIPFFTYCAILVVVHHIIYYGLEVFDFSDIWYILGKTLVSGLLTLFLILIYELLFYPRKVRKA